MFFDVINDALLLFRSHKAVLLVIIFSKHGALLKTLKIKCLTAVLKLWVNTSKRVIFWGGSYGIRF